MITIIHGDDLATSRNYFLQERRKTSSSVLLDGETLELTHLVQVVEGGSLFQSTKTVFIENFLTRKSSKATDEIISYIKQHEKEIDIVFWEGKEITKKYISLFTKAQVKTYKLPQSLFLLLDSLKPGSTNSIELFHKTLESIEPELLFFMLIRQTRILLALQDESSDSIDEVKRLAPWQKSKLKKQAGYFTPQQLKKLHRLLFEVDIATKTGNNSLSVTQAIDLTLVSLLR